MTQEPFLIRGVIEGQNSVLFETSAGYVLYEKLANTVHLGTRTELSGLQAKAESVDYHPTFEAESLKRRKSDRLDSLVLNVTERCNLACGYCLFSGSYENERTENDLDMSPETAKKAIDGFMPLSKQMTSIGFYGGEPLNNFGLIREVMGYIKSSYPEKTPVFMMTSNFCNVSDRVIEDLVKNRIYLTVSLDGPKEIHDRNRRFKDGRPTWDKIMENLRRLEQFSPEYAGTNVTYNATYKDPEDFQKIVKFFQENERFPLIGINSVESKGLKVKAKTGDASVILALMSDYLDLISSDRDPGVLRKFFDKDLKSIATMDARTMPEQLVLNGCCYPGNRKLFVDTDGTYYTCEKFGQRVPIGNVNEGINSKLIDRAIEKFRDIRISYCRECWAQRLCNPCIQTSKDPRGDISGGGLTDICSPSKSKVLIALANYVYLTKNNGRRLEQYLKSVQLK